MRWKFARMRQNLDRSEGNTCENRLMWSNSERLLRFGESEREINNTAGKCLCSWYWRKALSLFVLNSWKLGLSVPRPENTLALFPHWHMIVFYFQNSERISWNHAGTTSELQVICSQHTRRQPFNLLFGKQWNCGFCFVNRAFWKLPSKARATSQFLNFFSITKLRNQKNSSKFRKSGLSQLFSSDKVI